MSPPKTDFEEKSRAAWNGEPPFEVTVLAREANRTSSAKAARRIGYSSAVVSHVFANRYPGDIEKVKAKIRGALMSETVTCQVYGEIGTDRCLDQQAKKFTGASSVSARCYRACRSGCPHSRLKMEDDDADS